MTEYVRILKDSFPDDASVGCVGKVIGRGTVDTVSGETVRLVHVDVAGSAIKLIFEEQDIEQITKKEYFNGCLGNTIDK